jgi:hypothetical protein
MSVGGLPKCPYCGAHLNGITCPDCGRDAEVADVERCQSCDDPVATQVAVEVRQQRPISAKWETLYYHPWCRN